MKKILKQKDRLLQEFIKQGGRKGAKRDFFRLLKKAARSGLKQDRENTTS